MSAVFSIDVEEWFHILETDCVSKRISDWDYYPSRINPSMTRLLDVLEQHHVKATLFVLGWVAEKYPLLVKRAHQMGHEIASHGYHHGLIYELGYQNFLKDTARSKNILEDLTGVAVNGYRAPGFSLTPQTVWAYKALMELGFTYSSSVYPAKRAHGFFTSFGAEPRSILFDSTSILEFPMTVLSGRLQWLSCFGGGYFRMFPLLWYKEASRMIRKEKKHLIFYIHPRDIDGAQPRLALSAIRKFKSYINVSTTLSKIDQILPSAPYSSFSAAIKSLNPCELNQARLYMPHGPESARLSFVAKQWSREQFVDDLAYQVTVAD